MVKDPWRHRRTVTRAKTILDVLVWIETNEHHYADASDGKVFILRGHGAELRAPFELWQKVSPRVETARDPFDSRMYRATPYGNKLIRVGGMKEFVDNIQKQRPRTK